MKKILVCSPNVAALKLYTEVLHLETLKQLNSEPELFPVSLLEPLFFNDLKNKTDCLELVLKIKQLNPDLIHIQHEYGVFGSKKPFFYLFPFFIKKLKKTLPQLKITTTAHTVIPSHFSYPLQGRGFEIPLRIFANLFLKKPLLYLWNQRTWGLCDGVTVHSKHQKETVDLAGCKYSMVIPHFVPPLIKNTKEEKPPLSLILHQALLKIKTPIIFVFGYFTPEKGQDIAIEAFSHLKTDAHLILAGGIRRKEDEKYYSFCLDKIKSLHLTQKISVTGFIEFYDLDLLCKKSTLALLPFRETSGSGSLANLFTRSVPVLASNLKLNIEIDERVPGCLSFFESENPRDCAFILENLLHHPDYLEKLKEKSKNYAEKYSASKMASEYLKFFRNILRS